MFKNNKIKKLLAFSIISSGVLFCGTNAYAVKAPPNSGGPSTNPLTVRKPVFSPKRHLERMRSGDPGALGAYIVVNKSRLLVDVRELYPDIGGLSSGTLALIKYLYQNATD